MRFFTYSYQKGTGNPVVTVFAMGKGMRNIANAMNSITRLVSGLLSSLLLAAGFVRAADRFDPINNSLNRPESQDSLGISAPCVVTPCEMISRAT